MNISEQDLLSMLEEAYQSGYEGYFEQMTANCYAIMQKYKDENKHLAQSQNAELNSANLSVQASGLGDEQLWLSPTNNNTTGTSTTFGDQSENGNDGSGLSFSIPENITIQYRNGISYTL